MTHRVRMSRRAACVFLAAALGPHAASAVGVTSPVTPHVYAVSAVMPVHGGGHAAGPARSTRALLRRHRHDDRERQPSAEALETTALLALALVSSRRA